MTAKVTVEEVERVAELAHLELDAGGDCRACSTT